MSPVQRQNFCFFNNVGLLSIGPLETYFNEIWIKQSWKSFSQTSGHFSPPDVLKQDISSDYMGDATIFLHWHRNIKSENIYVRIWELRKKAILSKYGFREKLSTYQSQKHVIPKHL